jgi:hypothetical protein
MNPKCPRKACGGRSKPSYVADIPTDISAGRAPGVIGANVQNAAYDAAMNITMQDQNLTDVADHSRPGSVYRAGEATAPKLPAHLQARSESFWGSQPQNAAKTRTARVDLSPVFGQRAAAVAPAAQFKAEAATVLDPILKHKRSGTSPVPDHVVIAG